MRTDFGNIANELLHAYPLEVQRAVEKALHAARAAGYAEAIEKAAKCVMQTSKDYAVCSDSEFMAKRIRSISSTMATKEPK